MIRDGRGVMPSFSELGLRADEIQALAAFVVGARAGDAAPEPALPPDGPPEVQREPELTLFERAGCGTCHTFAAAGATSTVGPDLDRSQPSAAQAEAIIRRGRGMMPGFEGHLDDAQIRRLATLVAAGAAR